MNALALLYGGNLTPHALEPLKSPGDSRCALLRAVRAAAAFPGVEKIVLLLKEGFSLPPELREEGGIKVLYRDSWELRELFHVMAEEGAGYSLSYYAWLDTPLLDSELAGAIAERHGKYHAEYSYADGWPYGFAPEILAPGIAGILEKIVGEKGGEVERDSVFTVLSRDINNFDIETEIAPIDLRNYRISLSADSKRNHLLLQNLMNGGLDSYRKAAEILTSRGELLRTLPAFYAIQVSGPCPQACSYCPYAGEGQRKGAFMEQGDFQTLVDKIGAFSGDAVIDLSLWGEAALHPFLPHLVRSVLEKEDLSLILESSGLGWKEGDLEALSALASSLPSVRKGKRLPWTAPPSSLSFIFSLDAFDEGLYQKTRGKGYAEAASTARKFLQAFPQDTYIQAIRKQGNEDDIEKFYRYWEEECDKASPGRKGGVIIQKYDDFCGALPRLQASDLSPVRRMPCWHLIRDMNILLDGGVPRCRELSLSEPVLGNALEEELPLIWEKLGAFYHEQCHNT